MSTEHVSFSDRFEEELRQTLSIVDSGKLSGSEFGEIQNLHELHSIVSKFPEWPLDTTTIRKFVSVFVSPLVPIVLTWLFSLLVERFFTP